MSWGIDLRYYSNTSHSSISNHAFQIIFTEDSAHAATITEFGHFRHVHGKCILVNDVPMEDVQFQVQHSVYSVFDCINGEEVARCVDHETTPEVLGLVDDCDG